MIRNLVFTGVVVFTFSLAGGQAPQVSTASPVLVELFTSEGCSSCPPADVLLTRLDREQPVPSAHIIVLSEHIDYWNHDGWVDPYSSAALTARQESYVRRFGIDGPYTPEMVVDGRAQFNGSDARAAITAILDAASQPKAMVRITRQGDEAQIEAEALPSGRIRKANLYVAWAEESGASDVLRGENKGRRLEYVAIARDLKQIGTVNTNSGFQAKVPLKTGLRLIVFLQQPDTGVVLGSAVLPAA